MQFIQGTNRHQTFFSTLEANAEKACCRVPIEKLMIKLTTKSQIEFAQARH